MLNLNHVQNSVQYHCYTQLKESELRHMYGAVGLNVWDSVASAGFIGIYDHMVGENGLNI